MITRAPKGKLIRTDDLCRLNPFDRPVIETAMMLKESYGGIVTVVSMGPASAKPALYEAMTMGADRAVLACDPAFAGADTLATSRVLAAVISKLAPFDLVLFGIRTADSDTGHVGPQTSVLLDIPLVTQVKTLACANSGIRVERTIDGFRETYKVQLPAALTIHPDCAKPRDVSLSGITKAFEEKQIETLNIKGLGLSGKDTGDAGSPTKVLSMHAVKKDKTCSFIEGEPAEQADILVKKLTDSGLVG